MMDLSDTSQALLPQERSKPRIGIITALNEELRAIECVMDKYEIINVPGRGAGYSYVVGNLPAYDGYSHEIAVVRVGMGNNSAAVRASMLLNHFPYIQLIIMVGIAGGIPSPMEPTNHVRLGDIVVTNSEGIVQYDHVTETTKEVVPRFRKIPPSYTVLEKVEHLLNEQYFRKTPWQKHINTAINKLPNSARPSNIKDQLYDTNDQDKLIKHPKDPLRINKIPRLFVSPIASANRLLRNPVTRDLLRDSYKVKAIEMEGSGVADTSWQHEIGYIAIRGICDYCDTHKNDEWHNYAAVVAAAFTKSLLETMTPYSASLEAGVTQQTPNQKLKPTISQYTPIYSLELFRGEDNVEKHLNAWRIISTHDSRIDITQDYIEIGVTHGSTFAQLPIPPIKNCRVEWESRIIDDGGDPSNWVGMRLRGIMLHIGLGYSTYLRANGSVELFSVLDILGGLDKPRVTDARNRWTHIAFEIRDNNAVVFVNGDKHIDCEVDRFCGRDHIYLHTYLSRAQFRNIRVFEV